jgi:hypothetical protein
VFDLVRAANRVVVAWDPREFLIAFHNCAAWMSVIGETLISTGVDRVAWNATAVLQSGIR